MSWRSPKLLKAAKDKPCVLCGKVGTTVAAHANSPSLGKGMGIKAPDYFTVWVCDLHHAQIDGRLQILDPSYRTPFEMWQWAFVKTVEQWFQHEIVTVK